LTGVVVDRKAGQFVLKSRPNQKKRKGQKKNSLAHATKTGIEASLQKKARNQKGKKRTVGKRQKGKRNVTQ